MNATWYQAAAGVQITFRLVQALDLRYVRPFRDGFGARPGLSPFVPMVGQALRAFGAFLCHLLFQLRPSLFDHRDQFGVVLVVRVQLLEQFEVVGPKTHRRLARLVRAVAQYLQHAARTTQAGLEPRQSGWAASA